MFDQSKESFDNAIEQLQKERNDNSEKHKNSSFASPTLRHANEINASEAVRITLFLQTNESKSVHALFKQNPA